MRTLLLGLVLIGVIQCAAGDNADELNAPWQLPSTIKAIADHLSGPVAVPSKANFSIRNVFSGLNINGNPPECSPAENAKLSYKDQLKTELDILRENNFQYLELDKETVLCQILFCLSELHAVCDLEANRYRISFEDLLGRVEWAKLLADADFQRILPRLSRIPFVQLQKSLAAVRRTWETDLSLKDRSALAFVLFSGLRLVTEVHILGDFFETIRILLGAKWPSDALADVDEGSDELPINGIEAQSVSENGTRPDDEIDPSQPDSLVLDIIWNTFDPFFCCELVSLSQEFGLPSLTYLKPIVDKCESCWRFPTDIFAAQGWSVNDHFCSDDLFLLSPAARLNKSLKKFIALKAFNVFSVQSISRGNLPARRLPPQKYLGRDSAPVRNHRPGPPSARGIVGLLNLRNTCYMSSTLQCLMQFPILTDFFRSNTYVDELNPDNPLGYRGEIARAYAKMLNACWAGKFSIISPHEMKRVIAEANSDFAGEAQHDSQELLNFLLDALHEDLNRIKNKPATGPVESNGRPDAVVAKEAWDVHRLRHDSIVADCLQGQVKSKLVCPRCSTIVTTFDPAFVYTLALPVSSSYEIPVRVVYAKAGQPLTVVKIAIEKSATVKVFIDEISEVAGIPASEIVLCDIYDNSILKIYKPTDLVMKIPANSQTWAFHLRHHRQAGSDIVEQAGTSSVACDQADAQSEQESSDIPRTYTIVSVSNCINSDVRLALGGPAQQAFAPFPVELPFDVEVSGQLVRAAILDAASRFTGVTDLDDVKVLMWNRWSLSLSYREIGDRLKVTWKTTFKLVWPAEKANLLIPMQSEKPSAVELAEASVDLGQCFDLYTREETLSEDDGWRCPSCKVAVPASKQLDLWHIPRILVIVLKRFQNVGAQNQKISTLVNFPISGLLLDRWTSNPEMLGRRYDLFAVSNHFGSSNGGHYDAFVKSLEDGKWYEMDDHRTTLIDETRVITNSAYVLFYTLNST